MKCGNYEYNASGSCCCPPFCSFRWQTLLSVLESNSVTKLFNFDILSLPCGSFPGVIRPSLAKFYFILKSTIYSLRVCLFVPITLWTLHLFHIVYFCVLNIPRNQPRLPSRAHPWGLSTLWISSSSSCWHGRTTLPTSSFKSSSLTTVNAVNIFSELRLERKDDSTNHRKNTLCLSAVMSTNI